MVSAPKNYIEEAKVESYTVPIDILVSLLDIPDYVFNWEKPIPSNQKLYMDIMKKCVEFFYYEGGYFSLSDIAITILKIKGDIFESGRTIRWDRIIEMMEPVYKVGLLKYSRNSWRRGFKVSVMYNAFFRHLNAFVFKKETWDAENLEKFEIHSSHLGACLFCLCSIYHSLETYGDECDDRHLFKGEPEDGEGTISGRVS